MEAASMPANTGVPTARRLAAPAPSAMTRGTQAQDEGEARHHHRPETQPCPFDGGFQQRHALGALLERELVDQDRVLGGKRDQHDEADLGVDVEGEAAELEPQDRAQPAYADREQDRDRHVPALVESHQEQVGEQHGEAQDVGRLPGGQLLLVGGAGPFVGVAHRQRRLRQVRPLQLVPRRS